jgi:hypothetical protein
MNKCSDKLSVQIGYHTQIYEHLPHDVLDQLIFQGNGTENDQIMSKLIMFKPV